MDWKKRMGRKPEWRVDEAATSAEVTQDPAPLDAPPSQGRVVFEDEDGNHRRLPEDLSRLSTEQRDAALAAMSQALRAGPPDFARVAAIERLTEMHAAGRISEEQFEKERRRLESY